MIAFSIFGVIIIFLVAIGTLFYGGILSGLLFGIIGMMPLYFLVSGFLNDPLFQLVDGKGILCLGVDSTGYITPYNAEVALPNIFMKVRGKVIDGTFDRKITDYLADPKKANAYIEPESGDLYLRLPKKDIKKKEFRLAGARPTFFYNEKTGTFWDKDTLAGMESKTITENLAVLTLMRFRTFIAAVGALNKHFADLHKPNRMLELLSSPWIKALIIIILIVVVIMFLAPNLPTIMSSFGGVTETVLGATGGAATAPLSSPTLPVQ